MAEKKRIYRKFQGEPVIKAKITQHPGHIDFMVDGVFSAVDDFGNVVFDTIHSSNLWRVKLLSREESTSTYAILIYASREISQIEELTAQMDKRGIPVHCDVRGGAILLDDMPITDNTYYLLHTGEFNSVKDAVTYQKLHFYDMHTRVVKEKIRESKTVLEMFDTEYQNAAKAVNSLRILPQDDKTTITIKDVKLGRGYDWCFSLKERLHNSVFFRTDNTGNMICVAELGLEEYLRGVLPLEMRCDSPAEALKAQAVLSRGFAISRLGVAHTREMYDLCIDTHCQLFGGAGVYDSRCDTAVRETAGQVLYSGSKLCDSLFSPVCGGFTNDGSMKRLYPYNNSLTGAIDTEQRSAENPDLQIEQELADWVSTKPDVLCSHGSQKGLRVQQGHNHHSFRWSITVNRKDIETHLSDELGVDIGTLYDIIPVKRHTSGHIYEIEIVGSRKNIRIFGNENIRKAFSEAGLYSTCFSVERETGPGGHAAFFVFTGAGEGEGIGMCQSGAVAMAQQGKEFRDILKHYFGTDTIKRLY